MTESSIVRSIGKVEVLRIDRERDWRTIGDATGNSTIERPRIPAQSSVAAREELVQSLRQKVEPTGQ